MTGYASRAPRVDWVIMNKHGTISHSGPVAGGSKSVVRDSGCGTDEAELDLAIPDLQQFARAFQYRDYRRYRTVDGRTDQHLLVSSIREELSGGARLSRTYEGTQLNGVATLERLQWDSEFFGLQMAKLHLLVGPHNRKETAAFLLRNILSENTDCNHVALALDAQDFDARFAAEEAGFRMMDTLCSYEYHQDYDTFPSEIRRRYTVRQYEPRDRDSLLAIASKCFGGYPNRFSLDPAFGPDVTKRFYVTWTERCCDMQMAENLLVAEHNGRVIGFLGWRRLPDLLKYSDIILHGAGLGGCVPSKFNAYLELIWQAIREIGGAPAIFDTHLFNMATIHFYQCLGLRLVRARHTLHLTR